MANGYCTPLLSHIEAISGCNPAKKLAPLGFTQAVLSQMDDSITQEVNAQYEGGHTRGHTISYRKRALESEVTDTAGCDTAFTPEKQEFSLPNLQYRQVSAWMPNSLIRQYCKDASQFVKIVNGSAVMDSDTSVMREVYDVLIEKANALMRVINKVLVTQASTAFGKNLTTNSTAAKQLSFDLGTNGMQDAFVQLMADMRENEFCNEVSMIGNGPFANLDLIKKWFANGAADNGLNKANIMAAFPDVFYDKDTKAIWGDNNIGVFEKGSMALISYLKNVGNFAGRLANSEFFSMAMPVDEFCCPQQYLDRLMIDVQVREIDCATTLTVNGVNQTVNEGVQIILSKSFSLFTKPADLFYDATDPLNGTNGILRYEITSNS